MKGKIHNVVIVIFGFIFPVIILFQAYINSNSLHNDVIYTTTISDLIFNMSDVKKNIDSENDYALFSLLYVEHANQKTMINKQVMKSVIVNIGFAVISIGMMLMILGIHENKGVEVGAGYQGINFDFKTGSTGVAVFVVGAIMSTLGGVLKNDYQTAEIPRYVTKENFSKKDTFEKSIKAYKVCHSQKKDGPDCFSKIYFQLNKEYLK